MPDQDIKNLRVNQKRIEQRIFELAKFSDISGAGVNRVAFSQAEADARKYIINIIKEAGMTVSIDAGSNIIGRREGQNPDLPAIAFGSHIDTVPEGGKFDGALGVIAAIEAVQILNENRIETKHPLEVLVLTDEEGGLIGSRVMIGKMTAEALEVRSHSGKTVGEGIKFLGGDLNNLASAKRDKTNMRCFIELHIEQGSTLESEGINIGVVEGIVGIFWWDVIIEGFANHAGTTPMNRRQDALLSAAHLIIAVNEVVNSIPGRQVGTVGRITAEPGAPNVIPGKVIMSLEIRDLAEDKIKSVYQKIVGKAKEIAKKTETKITFTSIDAKSIPAPMDSKIKNIIAESAKDLGYSYKFMPSGAGHDAQNMATIVPTGLLFVPSIGGVSHSPKEYTKPEDLARGANVVLHTVLKIDKRD